MPRPPLRTAGWLISPLVCAPTISAWPNGPRSSRHRGRKGRLFFVVACPPPPPPPRPPPAPPQRTPSSIERAALAAIAAAVAPEAHAAQAPLQPASYGDVTVRPIA